MSALLWRVIIAVVCAVVIYALLPPLFGVIGLSVSGDAMLILRICIAGLLVLYILKGPPLAI